MQTNRIKDLLRAGKVAVGASLSDLATRGSAKIVEYAGLDWVYIDMEHSGLDTDRVADLIAWFKATDLAVLVRPPDTLYHYLAGIMDMGAVGIQAAHVASAEEAQKIVDAVMYPPIGHRGIGLNAAHTDFTKPKAAEYMRMRNEQTSVVALIESQEAVDNIDEIAAVDGIDMIEPTHSDLTVALGIAGQYDHPKYDAALRRVAEACRKHGKALKYRTQTDAEIAKLYALGCRVMAVKGTTDLFGDSMKNEVDRLRKRVAGPSAAKA